MTTGESHNAAEDAAASGAGREPAVAPSSEPGSAQTVSAVAAANDPGIAPAPATSSNAPGKGLLAGSLILFAGGPFAAAHWNWSPNLEWLICLGAGLGGLWGVGKVSGRSILTTERGRWSLARFQLVLWTWFVLSTFWAMVVLRIKGGVSDAAGLEIDQNLWLLMGISSASFVGSPLILQQKAEQQRGGLDHQDPKEAGFSDLVTGEENANKDCVDIGRVQMAFFTVVAVIVYFAVCWHQFSSFTETAAANLTFPPLSQSLVGVLGISHATYLANKIPDRSKTGAPS